MDTNELLIKAKKYIAQIKKYTRSDGKACIERQHARISAYLQKLHKAILKGGITSFISHTSSFSPKRLLFLMMKGDKRKTLAIAAIAISFVVALFYSFPPVPLLYKEPETSLAAIPPGHFVPEAVAPQYIVVERHEEPKQPEQLPILDLSGLRADIESGMRQINEPTAWGDEVLYSAGDASSIDGPVLTRLFLYDSNTHEEVEIAISNVRFGEIYEGRISDSWIVWLDTNQSGTNHIYALNRTTGKSIRINSTSMNRPQISLWDDFLVWTGQKEDKKDEMHVFNLATGRSVKVEDFDNPTFGTSSPAVHSNLLVWAYPHPDDPSGRSVIKTLDLTTLNLDSQMTDASQSAPSMEDAAQGETIFDIDIQSIDPGDFAIYPSTNGEAIAWLNSLNPAHATLKLTLDKGKTIMTVAEGVGRFFGIGEDFVVYTQQGRIMIYFWNAGRFATLTKEGEQGKLAELPVSGRTIIWYDATDPNRKQDNVKRSVIEPLP
jgi:hypothetical protein